MLNQDSNVKIVESSGMYQIIDVTTHERHKDCKVNLFETEELALQFLESTEDVKVKCGGCHDFSMLNQWKESKTSNGEVTCPICQGEFKDVLVIKEGMEAGMNCPKCLSDNNETYLESRDNHCLDCGFNWKITNSIDLEEYK